jgi:hypothetical protein
VIDSACESLVAGPAHEEVDELGGFRGLLGQALIGFGFVSNVVDEACDRVSFPILDVALNEFILEGIEEDLTTANAANIPTMPTANRASFFSAETDIDDTFTPGFFGALMPGSRPQDYPLFGADASDEVGIRRFNELTDWYQSRETYWDERAPGWGWICPPCAIERELRYDRNRDAYRKGLVFLDDLNVTYRNIIGAEDTGISTECVCIVNGSNGPGQFSFVIDCDDEPDICDVIATRNVVTSLKKPADGFILTESSMAAPDANYEAQFMEGSNHMQLKNDSNMEEAVEKIFDYGLGGNYFKTEKQ